MTCRGFIHKLTTYKSHQQVPIVTAGKLHIYTGFLWGPAACTTTPASFQEDMNASLTTWPRITRDTAKT